MPDNDMYTYNPMSNNDKELLMANGYKPGELPPDEEQDLLRDLREQSGDEEGLEPLSDIVMPDEDDGTE